MIKKEKHLIYLDWLKRFIFFKIELKLKILKHITSSLDLTNYTKLKAIVDYDNIHYRSTISSPKLRCVLTARSHAVLKSIKFSRFTFRRFANNGLVFGVSRATW